MQRDQFVVRIFYEVNFFSYQLALKLEIINLRIKNLTRPEGLRS